MSKKVALAMSFAVILLLASALPAFAEEPIVTVPMVVNPPLATSSQGPPTASADLHADLWVEGNMVRWYLGNQTEFSVTLNGETIDVAQWEVNASRPASAGDWVLTATNGHAVIVAEVKIEGGK